MNFEIEPLVLGELVGDTVVDLPNRAATDVTFAFDFYRGADLVTSYPVHLVRGAVKDAIEVAGMTGLDFVPTTVTKGDSYDSFTPEVPLPTDWWEAMIVGRAGSDDAWWGPTNLLTVTPRLRDLLRRFDLSGAQIGPTV